MFLGVFQRLSDFFLVLESTVVRFFDMIIMSRLHNAPPPGWRRLICKEDTRVRKGGRDWENYTHGHTPLCA